MLVRVDVGDDDGDGDVGVGDDDGDGNGDELGAVSSGDDDWQKVQCLSAR